MTDDPLDVVLVEPYFGGSHRAWAEGVAAHSGHDVELFTLEPRWWKWRMRGASVTLAERLEGRPTPDVMLVSDMIDLAAFRTFSRPHVGDVPTALYFHESQLTYPESPQMEADLHLAFTNWLSALAADSVFFNSTYHHDVFFDEMPRLLRHFPDHRHEHLIRDVEEKSSVLEVGVDLAWVGTADRERPERLRILWNHRWEHDKDPVSFFHALDQLADLGVDFEVVICGEQFRQNPEEFEAAYQNHSDRLVHMGFAPVQRYRDLVASSDVVVSTSLQEFFGVSVVEAVAAGCFPILPNRLSYPGLVPPELHHLVLYEDGELAARLQWAVDHRHEVNRLGLELAPSFQRFGWETMAPRYHTAIAGVISG